MKTNIKLTIIILGLVSSLSLNAADSFESWFSEGKANGNIKYYYIETKKDLANTSNTSAHSNSIGGQLSFDTATWSGVSLGVTFMTTNGFALPNKVDASTIGRDNGVREEGSAGGDIAQDSFSILGESFINYKYENFNFLYGRKVIKTPLIHAKEVRMLPSAVQGAFVGYTLDDTSSIEVAYLTDFKQRTSDEFTNIIEHALGDMTKEITGSDSGDLIFVDYKLKTDEFEINLYDYYAEDFFNAVYIDAKYSNSLSDDWKYSISGQYINQISVGNADDNLAKVGSVTGGKKISSNVYALKLNLKYDEAKFDLAYSLVDRDTAKHDSLIMPYDGTPLFTNTITSNALFASNYSKGLTSDSVYIGGSKGLKFGYTQTYDFTGVKGFKSSMAYLHVDNNRFDKDQEDYNLVLAYTKNKFSLALKGIWVKYNTTASADSTIKQDDKLTQYRVIANYKF